MKKFSRQRVLVMENLKSRYDHPTAEQLYESLRGEVSLPTVYRNLAQLQEDGLVMRLRADGADRFDAATGDHTHFECTGCGAVIDIDARANVTPGSVIDGCMVFGSKLMLYGLCPACQGNKS